MTSPITTAFLNQLKSLYPTKANTSLAASPLATNPWYIIAAVAFSASNRPEGVTRIFEHMLGSPELSVSDDNRMMLARKMREALFKSGLISGYPKAINALIALKSVTPKELCDTQVHRNTSMSLADYEKKGQTYWDSIYGANDISGMLHDVYPDLAWFSKTIGYGLIYSPMQHTPEIPSNGGLTPLETSYTLVAALIAADTPQQISWHLAGARRCGASPDEVRAARAIAVEVGKVSGVVWKNEVPELGDEDV